jgi:hypothetical protein
VIAVETLSIRWRDGRLIELCGQATELGSPAGGHLLLFAYLCHLYGNQESADLAQAAVRMWRPAGHDVRTLRHSSPGRTGGPGHSTPAWLKPPPRSRWPRRPGLDPAKRRSPTSTVSRAVRWRRVCEVVVLLPARGRLPGSRGPDIPWERFAASGEGDRAAASGRRRMTTTNEQAQRSARRSSIEACAGLHLGRCAVTARATAPSPARRRPGSARPRRW